MKVKTLAALLVLTLTLAVTLADSGRPTHAQSGELADCVPLDLLLIIDQSDSMRVNDRTDQRLVAAREALQRLYLNSGLNCPNTTSRVAVIEFGTIVQRVFDWQEVTVTSLTDRRWQQSLGRQQAQIVPKGLGETNFGKAFEEAAALFKQLPDDGAQRSIILITDGLPCVSNSAGSVQHCANPQYVAHYFNGNSSNPPDEWEKNPEGSGLTPDGLINQINRDFPARIYKLNVLYFDDPRAPEGQARQYANTAWRSLTAARGGKYIDPTQLNTRENIIQELSNIMNDLLNARVVQVRCDEAVYVEPYTSATVIFTAIGPRRFLNVRIFGPGNLVIQDGKISPSDALSFEYQVLDSVERYIIRNPRPGEWRVQGSSDEACRSVQITYEAVSVRAKTLPNTPKDQLVLVNVISPYSTPSDDGFIEIELRDSYDKEFREIEGHPLEVTARVVAAPSVVAKAKLDVLPPLGFQQVRPGVWRSDKLPAPERVPENSQGYELVIVGRVKSVRPGNETKEVFKLTAQYSTLPPTRIKLVPVSPREGANLALNRIEGNQSTVLPINVSARFVQAANDLPQPADLIFAVRGNAEQSVYASLVRNARTIERIALKPSTGDPTLFVGAFRTNVRPEERAENDVEGTYTIQFEVDPSVVIEGRYNTDTYVLDQIAPLPITINRGELFGLEIRPLSQPRPKSLINRFEGDKSFYNTLDVEAQIFDVFNNRPANVTDAFERTDGLVFATLYAPDNSEIVRIPLQYRASTNTFVGTFFDTPETQLESTGIHSIRFSVEDFIREGKPYQIIKNQTEPQFFERVLRTGVAARITRPRDGTTLDLNRIEGKTQVPIPFSVTVRFTDVIKDIPLDPRKVLFSAEANALQALRLEVRDADDTLFANVPLTEAQVGSTLGEITLSVPFKKEDFGRLKAVKFALVADETKLGERADPELLFELIRGTLNSVAVTTSEIKGASLQLVQLGTDMEPKADRPSRMPLYTDVWSAFQEQCAPAKIAFLIRDQDGQPLALEQMGITESDVNTITERLARLIRAQVLPPESEEPTELSVFRIEQRVDLPPVFVTEISADFNKIGNYIVTYRLDDTQLPRTIRPIQGEDGGSATLERFLEENFLLNPNTWKGVRNFIILAVALFVLNLFRVNLPIVPLAGHRISGILSVTINKVSVHINLKGFRLLRNIVSRKLKVDLGKGVQCNLCLKIASSSEANRYVVRYKLEFPKNTPEDKYTEWIVFTDWNEVIVEKGKATTKARFKFNLE